MPRWGRPKLKGQTNYSRVPMLTWRWADPVRPAHRFRSVDDDGPREFSSRQRLNLALCQRRFDGVSPRWQGPAKPRCSAHWHQA
eukprot:8770220-Pyramimonas_sp.AAC.1